MRTTIRPRRLAAASAAAAAVALAAGCGGGSDDARPAYCEDRDQLEQSIKGLADVDLSQGGLTTLQQQLQQVQDDGEALARSAKDEFGPQAKALQTSLTTLATGVSRAVANPSSASLSALADDVRGVGTAFTDLSGAVSEKC